MPSHVTSATPLWFQDAIQIPYQVKTVDVDNCRIEYYQWGDAGKPLLLLVHGNGGHANWWDFIAPSFTEHFCVCALHLGGMGNSGYRPEYTMESYTKELIAVAEHAGYTKDITIIGHSMGGMITIRAAEFYPEHIKSVIIIDTPLIYQQNNDPTEQHKPPEPTHHNFKGKRFYPDYESILKRFRLMPEQPCANRYLVDHVGHHSVRQSAEGWSWKFDEGIYFKFKRSGQPIDWKKIRCRLAYLYGNQSSLVTPAVIPELKTLLKHLGPVYEITGAHHHVMLDEPLQLIRVLKSILAI